MLTMQDDEQRRKLEQAMIAGAREYATGDGIRIPSAVLVTSGRKL